MNDVLCTGPDFDGLVNPYTGEPMKVVMKIRTGGQEPYFCAPDTFSPAVFRPRPDMERLLSAAPDPMKCLWTGRELQMIEVDGEVVCLGGFDPQQPLPRAEFLHYARMRDGAAPEVSTSRVEPVDDTPPPLSKETPVTQEAVDAMKQLTEPERPKTSVVVKGKKRRKR